MFSNRQARPAVGAGLRLPARSCRSDSTLRHVPDRHMRKRAGGDDIGRKFATAIARRGEAATSRTGSLAGVIGYLRRSTSLLRPDSAGPEITPGLGT